jgi:outer membrane protein assembly factor BamB
MCLHTNIVNSQSNNFTFLPSNEVINEGGWVAIDANNGTILWSINTPTSSITCQLVIVANGIVFELLA